MEQPFHDLFVIGQAMHVRTSFKIEDQVYEAFLFESSDDDLFPEIVGNSIFLSKAYHHALKLAPPENMQFRYVRIEKDKQVVGMLCFQISHFNPGNSLKNHMHDSFVNNVRYRIASTINLKVLCLGNTLVTGDYGFCFLEEIPSRLRTILMMETIDWMLGLKDFKKIKLVFVKDFFDDIFKEIPGSHYCKKYHPIDTQPNMIVEVQSKWNGFNGYLETLKSKYRVRAKKARQLVRDLEITELNLDEIESEEAYLHELYLKVVDDVGFNLFILPTGYFTALKKDLGDKFHVWVYKDKGDIISFFTVIEDGDSLDAHFLGYDPEVNHKHKLYLNMLFTMIDYASTHGFRQLQLSRTATEIKSSVGAEGFRMWAYMRFTNRGLNSWLPNIYSFFKPNMDWIPRSPFHEENTEGRKQSADVGR